MLRQHPGPTIKRKDGGINKSQQREGTHSQDSGKCICKSMERRAKIITLLPNKTLRENTECGVSVSRSFPVKELGGETILLGQGFHRSGNFKTCLLLPPALPRMTGEDVLWWWWSEGHRDVLASFQHTFCHSRSWWEVVAMWLPCSALVLQTRCLDDLHPRQLLGLSANSY